MLFLLVATGSLLALPTIKDTLLTITIAAPDKVPSPRSGALTGQQIPLTSALANARHAMPDGRLTFIDLPGIGDKPFRFRMQVPGDPHQRFPGSFVFVDQYSGAVLAVHDVRQGNPASAVNRWIRPLHDGSIGGLTGRILAVLLGLVPLFMFITGVVYWRQRLHTRTTRLTRDLP